MDALDLQKELQLAIKGRGLKLDTQASPLTGSPIDAEVAMVPIARRKRHKILLGLPGPSFLFGAIHAAWGATSENDAEVVNAGGSDNFQALWAHGLNWKEEGRGTHFAMLHSDVFPAIGFLDWFVREMERLSVSLISLAVAIKDDRGLMSCGVGDPNETWRPLRRLTAHEMDDLPDTFEAKDLGHPGGMLIHNNGCWLADLRDNRFFSTDKNGHLIADFNFPKRIKRWPEQGNRWVNDGESEDWYFSRKIHELGIRSAITKIPQCIHQGTALFTNYGKWGRYKADEDLRGKWDKGAATPQMNFKKSS
jgi:hypothetical protein